MHLSFAIPVVRPASKAADFGSETLLSSYPFGPATFRLSLGAPVSGRGSAASLKKGAIAEAVDSEGQEPATLTVLSSMASQRILCELTNACDHMASVGISIHATDWRPKSWALWRPKVISPKATLWTSRGRKLALQSARVRRHRALRANKQSTGYARYAKDLLFDRSERRSLESALREMGACPHGAGPCRAVRHASREPRGARRG